MKLQVTENKRCGFSIECMVEIIVPSLAGFMHHVMQRSLKRAIAAATKMQLT